MKEKKVCFYAVKDVPSQSVVLFEEFPSMEGGEYRERGWVSGTTGLPVDICEFAKIMGGWTPLPGERFTVKIKIKRDGHERDLVT